MNNRKCVKCGGKVSKNSKSGCCRKCRDVSGANNPFYGKTHKKETIDKAREKCREATKENWQNEEYRARVIDGTSKPRREGFKQEQSDRITQWYKDNPEQKAIRSQHMKKTWSDGKITPQINSVNESKAERKMLKELRPLCDGHNVVKKTIKLGDKWFYPDVIIDDKVIVEFFGDYYHANPEMYDGSDVVHHRLTAEDIWQNDRKRVETFNEHGYDVVIVWESDYKRDKETVYQTILEKMNEA